jgi:hypothetical protein
VSCFDAEESRCVGSPAGDDVSCAAVAVRGGMSLPEVRREMSLPVT